MNKRRNLVMHIALIAMGFVTLIPFAWMITTSLKSFGNVYSPPFLFPGEFEWHNYIDSFKEAPFARYYFNSVVMTVGIVCGHMIFNSMAAYAFARLHFPFKNTIFLALVGTMLVPVFLQILPAYELIVDLGWYDTYAALIVPRLADVFGIVVLRAYFQTIPREYEEAAFIDGAGRIRIFFSILLPLAKPALATVAVFSFLFSWNDFLWPLIVTADEQLRTIQLGLATFQDKYSPYPQLLMAGTVVAAIPAVLIFMRLQKALIRGMTDSGVKE